MKKFLIAMAAVLMLGCGWNAKALGPGELYVGAEGSYCVVHDANNEFGLFGINANYSLNLTSRLFLSPEVSLYYQHMPSGSLDGEVFHYPPSMPRDYSSSRNTFGGGLGAYLGLKFVGTVFLFSGPLARCNFYQKERVHYNGHTTMYDFSEHRANLLWRFGLGFDVWRLRVKASYDLYVTDRDSCEGKKDGAITLGIAYQL